ncbi:MAG: hypothetical protein SH857_06620 [Chitinophagales bacterium]|nr:hypothetical protein [Chitinophagales bacterium]
MNLKGGVMVIGSLLWEKALHRQKWKNLCLLEDKSKIPIPSKIRYGRFASSRNNYTMIFSNHSTTGIGQGFILGFKNRIHGFLHLKKQALALASAEVIWKKVGKPSINATWGTVGLLLNPGIDNKNKLAADLIRTRWEHLYQNYPYFNPNLFRIDEDEIPPIDANGFLQIEWTEQMNEFDLLIATPTKPEPRRLINSKKILESVNEYFTNNRLSRTTTYQDDEIIQLGEKSK